MRGIESVFIACREELDIYINQTAGQESRKYAKIRIFLDKLKSSCHR